MACDDRWRDGRPQKNDSPDTPIELGGPAEAIEQLLQGVINALDPLSLKRAVKLKSEDASNH